MLPRESPPTERKGCANLVVPGAIAGSRLLRRPWPVQWRLVMRIAVISDTHDHVPTGWPARLKNADEIWHLGDVCEPTVLAEIEAVGPPVRVVLGNCDSWPGWPPALELEREGVKFFLTHIPPTRGPAGVHAVLHGHTHVPRDETIDGVRWLNPGCISRPRGAGTSFAWLIVERGKLVSWKLVPV